MTRPDHGDGMVRSAMAGTDGHSGQAGTATLCAPDFVVAGRDGRERVCRVRPAGSDDMEVMFRCFRTTLREHVEPAFGWDEERERAGFALKFNDTEWAVLTVDGVFGGLAWMECGDEWALRLICIQPECQRLGIGRTWLQYIQARTREANRRMHLKVFKTNHGAMKLYQRLEFRALAEHEHMHELIFDPECVQTLC